MVGKNKIKLINSLALKKFRDELKLFVAEGENVVNELYNLNCVPLYIIGTDSLLLQKFDCQTLETDPKTLKSITNLSGNPVIIGVFKIPETVFDVQNLKNKLTIICHDIQNPGNLGTIIRVCNWFGIENIICSKNSVDCYNHKTVQASSGSLAGVKIFYEDIEETLIKIKDLKINILGTFPKGENIYTCRNINSESVVLFGNEGSGIPEKYEKYIDYRISIPSFNSNKYVESLNLSVAASIVISEIKRRSF